MRKIFLILFVLVCFTNNSYIFSQEISAAGYIMENDFGKITYLFASNESETKAFFNGFKNLFEEDIGLFIYASNDLAESEQKQEIFYIFLDMHDQFFYEWQNFPDTFTVIADVEESQITEYQVSVLSMYAFNVVTEFGLIDHLNFVYITSTSGDNVLFCNIKG